VKHASLPILFCYAGIIGILYIFSNQWVTFGSYPTFTGKHKNYYVGEINVSWNRLKCGNIMRNWWNQLSKEWQRLLRDAIEWEGKMTEEGFGQILELEELDCCGYAIRDLKPLTRLVKIECLDISDTRVYDLSPLKALPNLKELHADYCCFEDLNPIAELPTLEVLDISYPVSRIRNWGLIRNMSNLRELYCNMCNINTMMPLLGLEKLEILSICFNNLCQREVGVFREEFSSCRVLA